MFNAQREVESPVKNSKVQVTSQLGIVARENCSGCFQENTPGTTQLSDVLIKQLQSYFTYLGILFICAESGNESRGCESFGSFSVAE